MLEWDKAYATGFADIDDQHKQLFQIINRLEEDIQKGTGAQVIEEVLDFLEAYVDRHFGYEEECMHKHNCPIAGKNKVAHAKFIAGYHVYRENYVTNGATKELAQQIHEECEQWWLNHICKIDIHLKACTQSAQN